jgi:MFS family permease
MIVLDFFIVNVALPSMQADLQASTSAIEWVVAGYGLTFATCLITAGRLGEGSVSTPQSWRMRPAGRAFSEGQGGESRVGSAISPSARMGEVLAG